MRGIARRIRTHFGIGSPRMSIRPQASWYWRWLVNLLMMAAVAAAVWWIVVNSYRIAGKSVDEVQQRINALSEENAALKGEAAAARASLVERDRQLQIEKAAQAELARNVAQLQEENSGLKDDLAFLRKLMSSGATPEGIAVSDVRIDHDGTANGYRYRILLTQGGQRKQDFKGRLQLVAHVSQGDVQNALTFPDASAQGAASGVLDFRFYQKVEGRFALPEGALLKSVEVRILALPGGQVKLSRTVNFP